MHFSCSELRKKMTFSGSIAWGGGGGEGRGTPYNGLYGEAPPKMGSFFRVRVNKRVGISQVEVYKRVGKSVI